MDYFWVKTLHVTCAVISISTFLLCGTLQLRGVPWRQWAVLRVGPHVVDTVLLGAALWMVWRSGQYPFAHGWLTAKVLALVAYILFGMRAIGRNTPDHRRLPHFVASLISVAYIVGVALTRSPSFGLL